MNTGDLVFDIAEKRSAYLVTPTYRKSKIGIAVRCGGVWEPLARAPDQVLPLPDLAALEDGAVYRLSGEVMNPTPDLRSSAWGSKAVLREIRLLCEVRDLEGSARGAKEYRFVSLPDRGVQLSLYGISSEDDDPLVWGSPQLAAICPRLRREAPSLGSIEASYYHLNWGAVVATLIEMGMISLESVAEAAKRWDQVEDGYDEFLKKHGLR